MQLQIQNPNTNTDAHTHKYKQDRSVVTHLKIHPARKKMKKVQKKYLKSMQKHTNSR